MRRAIPRRRQRGVAVVTALLLTTLAVTIVASLFWQQQVQVRSMENQRLHLQTRWILRGALDWARLILRQDGIDSSNGYTSETGVWATPLAETRLDDYVERERVDGEDYAATIQGRIVDAQSRYNLANLADPQGNPDPKQIAAFGRLLGALQLDAGLAQMAAQHVARARQARKAASGAMPMELRRVEDLLDAGFPPAAVEKLRDYAIVLEPGVKVNVNTAPPEVLMAVVDGLSLSEAQTLTVTRKSKPFADQSVFTQALNGRTPAVPVEVRSDYFLVLSQVRLDRAALESWALIKRTRELPVTATLQWIREF